jgi:hypothetical protein
VNQRNFKTLAMQAHALTLTRYFWSLNVIIYNPIVQGRIGLSLRMCYRFAFFSSLPRVFVTFNKSRSYFASSVRLCWHHIHLFVPCNNVIINGRTFIELHNFLFHVTSTNIAAMWNFNVEAILAPLNVDTKYLYGNKSWKKIKLCLKRFFFVQRKTTACHCSVQAIHLVFRLTVITNE